MVRKDNYLIQAQQAKQRFLTYDQEALIRKFQLSADNTYLYVTLLRQTYRICRSTGNMQKLDGSNWLDGNTYETIELAKEAGAATLNYGTFLQAVLNFIIVAFCVFLFVKMMSKLLPKKEAAPAKAPRLCPYCKQAVHDEAVKCQHCGSDIAGK